MGNKKSQQKRRRASRKRKQKRKNLIIFLGLFLIIAAIVLVALIVVNKRNTDAEKAEQKKELEENGVSFPYKLDEDKLEIASVFQYSGTNPDCDDEDCEAVGSIQLLNASEDYLESADIIAKLADGSELTFRVEGIPSGKSVLAFEIKNQTYDKENKVIDITAETNYSSEVSLKEEELSFSIDSAGITVSNISQENLANITIKYHCNIDDMYFGGKCYESLVEYLEAGENVMLDASECYLGEAAVVNVIY